MLQTSSSLLGHWETFSLKFSDEKHIAIFPYSYIFFCTQLPAKKNPKTNQKTLFQFVSDVIKFEVKILVNKPFVFQ